MESEKVKEIKEKLQEEIFIANSFGDKLRKVPTKELQNLLTLINELEREIDNFNDFLERNEWESIEELETTLDKANKKCYKVAKENCELKDRISELEKEVETRKAEVLHLQEYGKKLIRETELKQFAEKVLKFVKEYAFKDSKEIYTNGTILVPLFRVEYALETGGQDYQQG